VWRKPGEELGKKKSSSIGPPWWWQLDGVRKHGSISRGNIHFVEGSMNKHGCVNILREHVETSAEKFGIQEHFAFYHESDPEYSSHLIRGCCLYNCPKVIKNCTPQSSGLNVIENLLPKLETEIRSHPVSNKGNLQKAVREEWERISPKYTHKKLLESIPDRLKEVTVNRGLQTWY